MRRVGVRGSSSPPAGSESEGRPALLPPLPADDPRGSETLPIRRPANGPGAYAQGSPTQELPSAPVKLPFRSNAIHSATSITHPEMPAVRLDLDILAQAPLPKGSKVLKAFEGPGAGRRQPIDELPEYEDDEIVTEVGARSTDFGAPPSLLSKRDRAVLLRMDGVHAGQVYALGAEPCTLGRHPTNTVRLDDPGISRFHTRVFAEAGAYWVEDLNSKNGTFVQGRPVRRGRVEDGDWVQLGPRVGFRFSVTDTREELLLRQLYESSTRDALTGAYNRRHFDERLRTEIAFAARHQAEVALVLFDLDLFKKVNDSLGHQAGDAVLRQVSALISRRLRVEDVFARVGGEEFAVILRGIDRLGSARAAERIRTTIATVPVLFDGRPIPVTISAGCASLRCSVDGSPESLVAIADRRLYAAKHGGRNCVIALG